MCYNQYLIISISFILHNDTNIYTVFSVNKEHTLWWTVCGLIWNCKQIKCSKVSHIPRRWIGHGLGGDTEALGSAGAFALLLCIYSVNASSCGIVCTQMQGCLMIIASQLHSGAGTEFFFFSSVAHVVCEAECGKQLQLKYSVTQLRTLPLKP